MEAWKSPQQGLVLESWFCSWWVIVCGGFDCLARNRPCITHVTHGGVAQGKKSSSQMIVTVIGDLGFSHIAFIYVLLNLPALRRALVLFGTKPCAGTVRLLVDAGTLMKLGDAMLGHHCELDHCGT